MIRMQVAIGSKTTINFIAPRRWSELSDAQLQEVFYQISQGYTADEIATLALLRWNDVKILATGPHKCIAQKGKEIFEITAVQIAELAMSLSWLNRLPEDPVRVSKFGNCEAIAADFQGVPLENFIICDNLYNGYLYTKTEGILDEMAAVMYPKLKKVTATCRVCVFYWFAALKEMFSRRFSDFFQPISSENNGNLLGSRNIGEQLQEAMDAQIRALTKGDITKEAEILALDTWRALTELNAQAREYKELQMQMKR